MTRERELYAVIMAGGAGTRFWPASRRSRPKQFLPIADDRSMIAATRERLGDLVRPENILVVTGEEHAALVRQELSDVPAANVLAEPVGRNTLPCIAWAAVEIERRDPGSCQIVMPSDHVIEPAEALRQSIAAAVEVAARSGALVTLGVRPDHAATGYGYIEVGAAHDEAAGHEVFDVARFVEKPDPEEAREFLERGFLWNSGMFAWTTESILEALGEHAPATLSALRGAGPDGVARVYPALEAVPVDVGVMEKATNVQVLPIAYAWSDVGAWSALSGVRSRDADSNCTAGGTELVAIESQGCIAYGEPGSVTALVGVKDLIVVHANGATLVLPKDRDQDVKKIVEELSRRSPDRL